MANIRTRTPEENQRIAAVAVKHGRETACLRFSISREQLRAIMRAERRKAAQATNQTEQVA